MIEEKEKSIRSRIADIRNPKTKRAASLETVNLTHIPKGDEFRWYRVQKFFERFGLIFLTLLILGGIFFALQFQQTSKQAQQVIRETVENFSISFLAIQNFRLEKASESLTQNQEKLSELKKSIDARHGIGLVEFVGIVIPSIRNSVFLFQNVNDLNNTFLDFTRELKNLEENGLRYLQDDGGQFIASLERTRDAVKKVNQLMQGTQNAASLVTQDTVGSGEDTAGEYLQYNTEIIGIEKFLSATIQLLKEPGEKHLAILFQNTQVIRPGGGVASLYADVTLQGGQIKKIDIHDMREVDLGEGKKIIPPLELQTETRAWTARDANWFFDFPASAETTLSFFEKSRFYQKEQISFLGLFTFNTKTMERLLEQTGPINLSDLKMSVSSSTYAEILNSRNTNNSGNKDPKKVLTIFIPKFLAEIKNLPAEKSRRVVEILFEEIQSRNVFLYARDKDMAHFFAATNADGGMYAVPNNFFGTYLAVAHANIGGGTDALSSQTLDVRIDLDSSAGIFTDMTLEKKNSADKNKIDWRRLPSKNFTFIFSHPFSSLVALKGNDARGGGSKYGYSTKEYEALPLIQSIENSRVFSSTYQAWTMTMFGKTVFGSWFTTSPGETKTLEMRSQVPASANIVVEPGKVYTFVFERQSGIQTNLKLSVSAPLGYSFKETGGPLYLFEDTTQVGRIVIPLTLTK